MLAPVLIAGCVVAAGAKHRLRRCASDGSEAVAVYDVCTETFTAVVAKYIFFLANHVWLIDNASIGTMFSVVISHKIYRIFS